MSVDLRLLEGKRVFVQTKALTYIVGLQQGRLMPVTVPDEKGNPVPLSVDYLLGKIEKVDLDGEPSFVLRYTLPDGAKMKAVIDPDFVQCCFFEDDARVELATTMPTQPPD